MSENPANKKVTIRVPISLYVGVRGVCKKEHMSFSKKVKLLLEREMMQKEHEKGWLL
ncbi:MAG TPA: hypothetical protein VF974_06000 [Patescibacteria group bacterium]